MDSNFDAQDSRLDDVDLYYHSFVLDSSPEPTATTPVALSISGDPPLMDDMQGIFGEHIEEIEAMDSGHSTQYSHATWQNLENPPFHLSRGDWNDVADNFLGPNQFNTSDLDVTPLLQNQTHISFNEHFSDELSGAGNRDELVIEQPNQYSGQACSFDPLQSNTESTAGVRSVHDNLTVPPIVFTNHHASINDESIQSPSPEQSPPVDLPNEKAKRRQRHRRKQGGYPCDQCPKRFDIHRDMARHREQHFPTFACGHCPRIFTHKKDLDRHVHCVHEGRQDHKCPLCETYFGRKDNMRRHHSNVHGADIS